MLQFHRKINAVIFLIAVCTSLYAVDCRAAVEHWWNGSTFYEIFVRSFQDSNGDGIGDLKGITSRLNYLNNGEADTVTSPKSLGVKGIWLTPIFASPSYHGYDATNYKAINPSYGTMDDFHTLIRDAHQRGIKVILDIAVNHTSKDHPWFVDAKSSPKDLHRDWYVWRSTVPSWGQWYQAGDAYYYSVFGPSMPNLNWRNPAVLDAVKDVLRFWMNQGADGFRLDAARYYVPGPNGEPDSQETHKVIEDFAGAMRSEFPNVMFVGEIWADAKTINSYCATGKELDLGFNFPVSFSLMPTINSENTDSFVAGLREYMNAFVNPLSSAPFLTNHDMTRVASLLWKYEPKIRLAAEIYFTLPGTPFVYYGEELGLPNGDSSDDRAKRQPMQWNTSPGFGFTSTNISPWQPFYGTPEKFSVFAQDGKSGSLIELYKKLIHLRNRTPILSKGSVTKMQSVAVQGVVLWLRQYKGESALVVVNFSYKPSIPLTLDAAIGPFTKISHVLYGSEDGRHFELHLDDNPIDGKGLEIPSLPPHSTFIFQVD